MIAEAGLAALWLAAALALAQLVLGAPFVAQPSVRRACLCHPACGRGAGVAGRAGVPVPDCPVRAV